MNRSGIAASATTLVVAAVVGLLVVAPPAAIAQTETPEDRLARLIDNRDELNITLQVMDLDQTVPSLPPINPRTTWMSGRPVQVVVYITNPTAGALEIPDPLDARADEFKVCYREGLLPNGTAAWLCGDPDDPPTGPKLDVPSRVINPGETLVVAHKSTEVVPGTDEFWLGEAGLPRSEGRYSFGYLGASCEIDIVAPIPLASVLVPLHRLRTYVDTVYDTAATGVLNMMVFSVSDNGWPTICWGIGDVQGPVDLWVGPEGRLGPLALNTLMPIGVYALPAVGGAPPGPIKTLTASADASDRITIDYSGNDGVHHLLQLNAARRLAQPNEETISAPSMPGGADSGAVEASYPYTAGGAVSSLGHPVQYIFDWGDGTFSDWLDAGTTTASQAWSTAALYPVVLLARCSIHGSVISDASPALMVTIGGGSKPTLAAVSPNDGLPGASVQVTLTGTNFFPGAGVAASNPGITVGNVTRVSMTQMLATLTIAANASLGGSNLTVINSAGLSAPASFTVNTPAPMLTAVSPATGLQGGSVPVTLSGTHFVSGATIAVSNPLIGATKVRAVSSTQITAELFVRAGAAVGPATITVTTFAGTSNPVTFTVGEHETIPPPGYPNGPLSGISGMLYQYTASPATSNLGHVVEYSFDWGDGSQSGWMPQGVTTSSHTWTTPGTYVVGAQARCMTHTAVSIRSARVTISVTANPPPVLASISPAAGQLAFSEFVTISGSGFVAGATVAVSDPEVIVSNVTIVNSTQITATFAIGFGASLGAANVTVTTPAGTSNAVPFTIGSQPPAINVLSPASLARNSGQDVMIMGSFFTPTATVAVSNPGVSVLYPMAYGSNIMSAIFMVAADAPLGPCNVTVTTASGTSAAAVFTVR